MTDQPASGTEPGTEITPPAPRTLPFEFHGSGAEYFRIWIVNLALTVITAGIYSAWAKVRRLKYLHGATVLDGSAFGYHGDPLRILKGRLIATALFVAYVLAGRVDRTAGLVAGLLLSAVVPWLVVKSMRFRTRMTSWRGLRFDFNPDYAGIYRIYLILGTMSILTIGLLLPLFLRQLQVFVVRNVSLGDRRFECEAPIGQFYLAAMQFIFATVGLGLVMAIVLIAAAALVAKTFGIDPNLQRAFSVLLLPAYLVAFMIGGAFFQARTLNAVLGHTRVPPHDLRSDLSGKRLAWIQITNLAGIVCTLGLYTPWATIRHLRYRMESLAMSTHDSLDDFLAGAAGGSPSAVGEEVSDFFDVDFGL